MAKSSSIYSYAFEHLPVTLHLLTVSAQKQKMIIPICQRNKKIQMKNLILGIERPNFDAKMVELWVNQKCQEKGKRGGEKHNVFSKSNSIFGIFSKKSAV